MLVTEFENEVYKLMRSLDVMQYEVQEGMGISQHGFEKFARRNPVAAPVLRFANVLDCDVEIRFVPRRTAERRQDIALEMKKELNRMKAEKLAPYNISTGIPPQAWEELRLAEAEIKEKYRAQMPKLILHKLEEEQ